MVIKRILACICILLLSIPVVSANLTYSTNQSLARADIKNLDNGDSHIIDDVPYVGQETHFYCSYASVTMLLQYYGINTTLKEVLFNSGVGYSKMYAHYPLVFGKIFPDLNDYFYFRLPVAGYNICQSSIHNNFLAELYNLTFKTWFPRNFNNMSISNNWDEYWQKIQQNITKDIPVITSVNTKYLPYLNESSGHGIVIVGFNNSHVFYNDPASVLYTSAEDGTYANMSLSNFSLAVNSTPGTNYIVSTFEKTSDEVINKTEVFEKAHRKNIRCMKGFINEYFLSTSNSCDDNFGYKSLKLFKRDFWIGVFHRMLTIQKYYTLDKINNQSLGITFNRLSIEKDNISQYLLENIELSPEICKHDAMLFEKEANCWKNISKNVNKIVNITNKQGFYKGLFSTFHLTRNIRKELNELISIEKAIIKGPIDLSLNV